MTMIPSPPPARPKLPQADLSRPCIACRHGRRHGFFARVFSADAIAPVTCEHPHVRTPHIDPVRGIQAPGRPADCDEVRAAMFGPCGPEGRLFEPKG